MVRMVRLVIVGLDFGRFVDDGIELVYLARGLIGHDIMGCGMP